MNLTLHVGGKKMQDDKGRMVRYERRHQPGNVFS